MRSDEHIVGHTADEFAAMKERGEVNTDFAYLDALTEVELQASIDFEDESVPDWSTLQAGFPGPKQSVTLEVDRNVIG
ncbi:MAG: hypothetical protein M3462_05485 [Chloroflexota bacterium]|nr:hypothetical protein [Chloroflexota bacterium]